MRSLGFLGTCGYFFYDDDMKLFRPVRGCQDCLKIQSDLNRLAEWCEANALELNVGKWKSMLGGTWYMLGGISSWIVLTLSMTWE
jgi:hypothetical protein